MRKLKKSAKKWTKYADNKKVSVGNIGDCPLCKLFYTKYCKGCPIADKIGLIRCAGSPYEAWLNVKRIWHVEQPFAEKVAKFLWDLYFELGGEKRL